MLVILSCKNSKYEGFQVELINPDKLLKLRWEDVIADSYQIQLETGDSILISRTQRIRLSGDRIFIFDDRQLTIFIFDLKGKYISKICPIGKGPDDIPYINDFQLTSDGNISLDGGIGFDLYIYDKNGKFLFKKEKDLKEGHLNRVELKGGQNVYYFGKRSNTKPFSEFDIAIVDSAGNWSYFIPSGSLTKTVMGSMESSVVVNPQGRAFFLRPYTQILYEIEGGIMKEFYKIDFGSKNLPNDVLNKHRDFESFRRVIFNSGDYTHIFSNTPVSNHYIALPISNKDWKINGIIFKSLDSNKNVIASSIKTEDGIELPLLPRASYGDYFVNVNDGFQETMTGIGPEDDQTNPTLFFYKLK